MTPYMDVLGVTVPTILVVLVWCSLLAVLWTVGTLVGRRRK